MCDRLTRLLSDDYEKKTISLHCQIKQALSNILQNDCFDMSFEKKMLQLATKKTIRKKLGNFVNH